MRGRSGLLWLSPPWCNSWWLWTQRGDHRGDSDVWGEMSTRIEDDGQTPTDEPRSGARVGRRAVSRHRPRTRRHPSRAISVGGMRGLDLGMVSVDHGSSIDVSRAGGCVMRSKQTCVRASTPLEGLRERSSDAWRSDRAREGAARRTLPRAPAQRLFAVGSPTGPRIHRVEGVNNARHHQEWLAHGRTDHPYASG